MALNNVKVPSNYRVVSIGRLLQQSLDEFKERGLLTDDQADLVFECFDTDIYNKLLKRVDNRLTMTVQRRLRQDVDGDGKNVFYLAGVKVYDDSHNPLADVPLMKVSFYEDQNPEVSGVRIKSADKRKKLIVPDSEIHLDMTALYRSVVLAVIRQAKKVTALTPYIDTERHIEGTPDCRTKNEELKKEVFKQLDDLQVGMATGWPLNGVNRF